MIAYNQLWLDALWAKGLASEWQKKGLLADDKWTAIKAHYTDNFYSPNFFIRIGLAIFCLILLFAAMGLVALFVEPGSDTGFSLFALFWGIVWLVVLESWAIRSARHYASGIDDMLLYIVLGAILTGICSLLHYSTPALLYYSIALPFLVLGSIRYLDRLMAAVAFCCALIIVLLLINDIPKLALYLLPFSGMLFSAIAYYFARNGQGRISWRHWHGLLVLVELLALATFYVSGNYWLIQQVGASVFQLEQVPLAWFYWTFTFIVPLIYILLGLHRGDRMMLDVGLLSIAAAAFTFRYFIHVLPIAWAAVIGGAILFAIAYFSIQYLRKATPKGYTYDADTDSTLLQEIGEQLIEQTITNQPHGGPDKKDGFGGGQFGGGGASGDF